MRNFAVLALIICLCACSHQAPRAPAQPDPDQGSQNPLLLRDFHPVSKLHTPEHRILRAKFPVFDMHSHINDAAGIQDHQDPKHVLEMMDATNVKSVLILTGMWGEKLQKVIDEMVKPYPGRFYVFAQLDWSRIDEPGFAQAMVEQLRDSVKRGARGLKFLKDFGFDVRFKNGQLLAIDDRRLDPIWEECARLHIPVAIHTSDPEAFFDPINGQNERYDELVQNPSWGFSNPKRYPRKQDLLAARDRVFERHPHTTFIALHFANWPENLEYVDKLLTRLPNVQIEFGARVAELGRQPYRARKFFLKHQDRIMFGSDNDLSEELYRVHFRWLETWDEYFDYWEAPGQGRWKIYGLGLPDKVLEKVYFKNAERLLGLQR